MALDRILVVDDSGTIRRVVDNALTSAGFIVDVAKNGDEGLAQARQERPDLLLLDFRMPGMNGFQVGKAIARDDTLAGIPIVLMCTRTDRLPDHDLASIGVLSTLIKPFSPEALVERIRFALNEAKSTDITASLRTTFTSEEEAEDSNENPPTDFEAVPSRNVFAEAPPDGFSMDEPEVTQRATPPGPPPVTDEGDDVESQAILSAIDVAAARDDRADGLLVDEDAPAAPDATAANVPANVPPPPDALINSAEFQTVAKRAAEDDLKRALVEAFESRGIEAPEELAIGVLEQVKDKLAPSVMAEFVRGELPPDILRRPVPAMFGDLTEVPLPEILQLLKFQGQTGVLEVALDQMRFEATFHEGRIHTIRGVNVRAVQRLGRYFVRAGVVTEEQLEDALKDDRYSIGAKLLDEGVINEEDLRNAVRAQVEDLMFEMLRCRQGTFGLRRANIDEDLPFAGFSVDALLFEGLRRIDERSVIGQEVPSVDSIFIQGKDASPEGLSKEEARALAALDKKKPRAIHALANDLDLSIDDAMMLIYRLVILGRARRVRRAGEPAVGPPPRPKKRQTDDSLDFQDIL